MARDRKKAKDKAEIAMEMELIEPDQIDNPEEVSDMCFCCMVARVEF